jgi:hypothetical protein
MRPCSADVETRLWAGRPRNQDSFPLKGKRPFYINSQVDSGVQLTYIQILPVHSPVGWKWWACETDDSP